MKKLTASILTAGLLLTGIANVQAAEPKGNAYGHYKDKAQGKAVGHQKEAVEAVTPETEAPVVEEPVVVEPIERTPDMFDIQPVPALLEEPRPYGEEPYWGEVFPEIYGQYFGTGSDVYRNGMTIEELIDLLGAEPVRVESTKAGLYEFHWVRKAFRITIWMDGNSSVEWSASR